MFREPSIMIIILTSAIVSAPFTSTSATTDQAQPTGKKSAIKIYLFSEYTPNNYMYKITQLFESPDLNEMLNLS